MVEDLGFASDVSASSPDKIIASTDSSIEHFGLANTSYVLMRFCQRFDKIRYTDERDNYSKAVKLTVSAGKGVRVQLHRAENGH